MRTLSRMQEIGRRELDYPRGVHLPALPPLHERVRTSLAAAISSGSYRPGSKLPSERALSESLRVSRLTVRKAMNSLVEDGMVTHRDGRGWFVTSSAISERANELLGFTAMAERRGFTPTSLVISSNRRPAEVGEAEALKIAPGSPVLEVERLRLLDGVPTAVHRVRVPLHRLPFLDDIDLGETSLHAAFEQRGVVPTEASYEVQVVVADEHLASLLEVRTGTGLLLMSGATVDQHREVIELGWVAYHPDRYRLQTTFRR